MAIPHRTLIAIIAWLGAALPALAVTQVTSEAGNIQINRDGVKQLLTHSGRDIEPALSPDGALVVFTRQFKTESDDPQNCADPPNADELRRVSINGGAETLLLRGHNGKAPPLQICGFSAKQFTSDGRLLYFLSPGWATSAALHVYDFKTGSTHFVIDANNVVVLSFCNNEHKDRLVIQRHRYFYFGGSYDWYWLYDPKQKKELGPIGEFDTAADVLQQAEQDWCRR